MQYANELYFDKETEERLYALSKRAAEEKLSEKFLQWKTGPHLTLACFNDVDEEACARKLEAFSKAHGPLPAHLASVGMFPDTKCVFASPVMTEGMYAFQKRPGKLYTFWRPNRIAAADEPAAVFLCKNPPECKEYDELLCKNGCFMIFGT